MVWYKSYLFGTIYDAGVNLLSQQSWVLSMVLFHVAAVILSPDPTSVPTPLLTGWPKNAQMPVRRLVIFWIRRLRVGSN